MIVGSQDPRIPWPMETRCSAAQPGSAEGEALSRGSVSWDGLPPLTAKARFSHVPIVPTARPRVRPPASAGHPGAAATGYEQMPERSAGPSATTALQSKDQLAMAVASSFGHPAVGSIYHCRVGGFSHGKTLPGGRVEWSTSGYPFPGHGIHGSHGQWKRGGFSPTGLSGRKGFCPVAL